MKFTRWIAAASPALAMMGIAAFAIAVAWSAEPPVYTWSVGSRSVSMANPWAGLLWLELGAACWVAAIVLDVVAAHWADRLQGAKNG